MKKALAYILTPIFYLVFGSLLVIFHLIQVICWNVFGYLAQKRAVEIMNLLIIKSHLILGSRAKFVGFEKLPKDIPLIIVSNHQSQFDI
ncbi:MAG: 1-acyl-sn-glycerol-3-phosphate acyltransferase, partial [Cyclobacteriaceae bacterium]|nr:1-acyl-sn-glycerol-3-phosphate acyltransferase [Cyclobacteriaceae bacterium]